jgi:hypothetical protein
VMVQDVDDRGRDGMTEEREVRSGGVVRGGRNTSTGQFTATSGVSAPLLCSLLCLALRRGLRALAWLAGLPLSVCLAFPVSFHHSVLSAIGHWLVSVRLKHTKQPGGSPPCFVCKPSRRGLCLTVLYGRWKSCMPLKGARPGDRHFIGWAVPCLQLVVITWRMAVVQYPSWEPVWHGWYLLSFGVKCFLKRRLCVTRPRSRPFDGTQVSHRYVIVRCLLTWHLSNRRTGTALSIWYIMFESTRAPEVQPLPLRSISMRETSRLRESLLAVLYS